MSQFEATINEEIQKKYGNSGGIIILQNGESVYENYYNNQTNKTRNHIFSVTKSIVSMLLGICIDQGLIESEDEKILKFFPSYIVAKNNKAIYQITIRDIITMTAPYRYIFPNYIKYFSSDDWLKASLDAIGGRKEIDRNKEPKFYYAGIIGPDILSGIISKVSGKTLLAFAQENLFNPLGIDVEKSIIFYSKEEQMAFYKNNNHNGWVSDPKENNTAAWGLSLTLPDMAKLGQLMLDKGCYKGKQIISSNWVAKSTAKQSYCKKFQLEYAYLWWRLGNNTYAAMGDGGNVIYINPDEKIVIAQSAIFDKKAALRIPLIKDVIEPMLSK